MSYFIVKCKWIAGNNRNDCGETLVGFISKWFKSSDNLSLFGIEISNNQF